MRVLLSLSVLLVSLNLSAAGYEKSVLWSAKWSALGGSSTAAVSGADAAFFNPAGLVFGPTAEIGVSLSPTFTDSSGTVLISDQKEKGEQSIAPVFGITFKSKINDRLAYGLSLGVTGGSNSKYESVSVPSPFTLDADQLASIKSTEFAASVGYKLSDHWSLGAAWRFSHISVDLKSVYSKVVGPSVILGELTFSDLTATDSDGFKLGAQFNYAADWGMGFTYKSSIDFSADGTYQNRSQIFNGSLSDNPTTSASVSGVKSSLPESYSIDYFRWLNKNWGVFTGFTKTMYSKNQAIDLGNNPVVSSLVQNWKDQENLRFATEYKSDEDWVVRGAYVYTSQVTPSDMAYSTFSPPAAGHTFVVGGGKTLLEKYIFDIALEYSYAEATQKSNSRANPPITGDFDVSAFAMHASVNLPF